MKSPLARCHKYGSVVTAIIPYSRTITLQYTLLGDYWVCVWPARLPVLTWVPSSVPPGNNIQENFLIGSAIYTTSPSRGWNFPPLSQYWYLQLLSLTLDSTVHVLLLTHSSANSPQPLLHKSNVLFTSHVTKQIITAPLSLGCLLNWEILQDPQARRYGVRRTCCGKSFMEENVRFPVFSSPPSLAACLWRPPSSFCGGKVGAVARVMIRVHIAST